MADTNDSEAQNMPAPGPQRRQRAPTITIDTSAVNPNNTNMGGCVSQHPSPTPSVHAEQPMSSCSEEDLEDDLDDFPDYHVPQYTYEPLSIDAIPSAPRDFADLFPTAKRISIRHDDSSIDGNMNLRVDTQIEERHHEKQNYTLFHLRMHELRTREFSLRRYCRDSGREVCRSTRKYQSSNSQSFLAVPGPRSRGNSRILDDKPTSSGTYIPSSQGDTVRGDHNPNEALNDKGVLKPDPGTEADFGVKSNPFAFSPGQLGKMFNPKSLAAFHALGGLDGLERGLRTDRKAGLSADEQYLDGEVSFEEATAPTTSNVPPKLLRDGALDGRDSTPDDSNEGSFADHGRQRKSIFKLAWMAYNDKVLILLTAAAVVSLALGLYQTHGVEPLGAEHEPGIPKVKWVEGIAILAAILGVAIPEGFPLAVVSALAFATTRMLKDNNLVRALEMDGAMGNATTICSDKGSDSEAMGNATTICSDKTGTLTQNKMTVVAGTLGTALKFGDKEHASSADDMSPSEFVSTLNPEVKDLLLQSIVQNSTAFEGEDDMFIGSKTETALLHFARDHLQLRTGSLNAERWNANVVQVVPFDSGRKCCAVVVKLDDGRYRMYVKGASEILLGKCDRMVSEATQDFLETSISVDKREALGKDIETYASHSLRTIGLVYRDFESWPPTDSRVDEDNSTLAIFEDIFKEMVFLAVIGIHDPLRKSATSRHSQHNGVIVRMVTGDNVLTARAIAKDCGIGGVTMEGPDFKNLSKRDMDTILPKLRVLARSSPEDKRMLVRRLKALDENVAVTGDGPSALKAADIGFSMGIAGTEVAREASAIILMDDNFASIIKALRCSRAINDATKDFLSGSVAAKLLTIIPAFAATNLSPTVSSLLQFLGVNLIMETFAALNSRSTVLGRLMPKASVAPIYTSSTPKHTRRRHDISFPGFPTLMASSLFIPGTAAQTTPSTADENWRQRALDTLSELIVSCAVLLAPTIILIIAGCIVLILLWLEAEGTLSLFMLGMASIFATIRPAPEPSQPDDDCYIRLAVGLSYILFMLAYCRLVVLRHRHGKVFSTIAVVLAALSTTTAMAIPPVREYWIALTNLNPTFALSLAIPSSFFLADLAVYIIVAVNHHMDKDELSSPARLEASVGGSLAGDSSIPRDRTYRIRNIPIRRFRSPYGSGSGSVEEGNDASTSPLAATRTSQPRQTRRLRIYS